MPQPPVRRNITAALSRVPAPVPALWARVDRFHERLELLLTRIEHAHIGIVAVVAVGAASSIGIPMATLRPALDVHDRVWARIYRVARRAQWYV